MKFIEYKDFVGSVKDVDTKNNIITGYLSDFDTKDSYDDVVVKGAFAKSLAERKDSIMFLNQHNWAQPHGKFNVLMEDSKGLYFESKPLIDTSYSKDVIKLYEAGIMKEHSIGYSTVKNEWDNDKKVNYLKEVKLYEGSNVTRGANPNTPFTGFKSDMTLTEINEQQKLILKAFRSGTFTDETFMLLEVALKQLQQDAYELGKKSLEKEEPSKDTPIILEPTKQIETINEFIKTL